jgi:coenzyme PQQ precursor peptide PqqA
MDWETPSFVEVKMDAEINSYQDDFADTLDMTEPSLEDRIGTAVIKVAG